MSDWKVGDLVTTHGYRDEIIYKIIEINPGQFGSVGLEVIWTNKSVPGHTVGDNRQTAIIVLDPINEMFVLSLAANGDLNV